jgi:hypothetical protein
MNLLAAFRELGRMGKLSDVEAITEATGGVREPFATLGGLETRIGRIGEELHAQYQITYEPPKDSPAQRSWGGESFPALRAPRPVPASSREPGYPRITVELPRHERLQVRARPGYWQR